MPGGGDVSYSRQDPPVAEWAGRWATEEDVQNACGDERDWFTYEMRHKAYDDAWARYYWSSKRKRNHGSKFKFAQINDTNLSSGRLSGLRQQLKLLV